MRGSRRRWSLLAVVACSLALSGCDSASDAAPVPSPTRDRYSTAQACERFEQIGTEDSEEEGKVVADLRELSARTEDPKLAAEIGKVAAGLARADAAIATTGVDALCP